MVQYYKKIYLFQLVSGVVGRSEKFIADHIGTSNPTTPLPQFYLCWFSKADNLRHSSAYSFLR